MDNLQNESTACHAGRIGPPRIGSHLHRMYFAPGMQARTSVPLDRHFDALEVTLRNAKFWVGLARTFIDAPVACAMAEF